jgi:hypothetical protein
MKLGVITDGISRDLGHALTVMDEFDLDYAELQFIDDKEVGDLDDGERAAALELIASPGICSPACPWRRRNRAMRCTHSIWTR